MKNKMFSVYFDLDGTLAEWIASSKTSDLYKKGYFRNLRPDMELCEYANALAKNDLAESHILTSYLADSAYAKDEKLEWISEHVGDIPHENILCVPYGVRKSSFVEDIRHRSLSVYDVLIDDHSPNLIAWEQAGGTAIKWCNGINDSRQSRFTGLRARTVNEIADKLEEIACSREAS